MHWTIYSDAQGLWHWEMLSATSDTILQSAQGYASRGECVANAKAHGYTGQHTGPIDQGDLSGEEHEDE